MDISSENKDTSRKLLATAFVRVAHRIKVGPDFFRDRGGGVIVIAHLMDRKLAIHSGSIVPSLRL